MTDLFADGTPTLVAPGTVAEVRAARRTVAAQACRLTPGAAVDNCRLVLDVLGLLPGGERVEAAGLREASSPRCHCAGGAFYTAAENAARKPPIVASSCPMHGSRGGGRR